MLHIEKIGHVTHAVRDREAATALYQRVLGARVFHEGFLEVQRRHATLLLIHDLCVELIDTPPDADGTDAYVVRHGGRFHSATLRVPDVHRAAEALLERRVRIIERHSRRLVTLPDDTHGLRLEFTDADLPDDPRLAPGWDPDASAGEHGLDLRSLWSLTVLVENVLVAKRFFTQVLGGVEVNTRLSGEHTRMSVFLTLGSSRVSILVPKEEGSELTRVLETQGAGIHGVCLITNDQQAASRYLRAQGLGLLGHVDVRLTVHPRSFMGARYLFMPQLDPNDPDSAWRQPDAVAQ